LHIDSFLSSGKYSQNLAASLMNAKTPSASPKAEIRFIQPMYARLVNGLPKGKEWLYEVKFDGYRCLAI
jgi:bifunctional non-homologous end joining protein LigD